MAVAVSEEIAGRVLEVDLSGKLTREDYERFAPKIERLIQQHGKIRVLAVMREFEGWKPGALWEDIKFDARHFSDIERLALVGDKRWEKGMSVFCKPFTTAEIRFFELADVEKAREWLKAD